MNFDLCVTPERYKKTLMMMKALQAGYAMWQPDNFSMCRVVDGSPSSIVQDAFVVWGQEWLSLRIIPEALRTKRPFYHMDNGFIAPARGGQNGYYRITYRQMWPHLIKNPDFERSSTIGMQPWRQVGHHVLLALPGITFGRAMGLDVPKWASTIQQRLKAATKRPILVRAKRSCNSLENDLDGAWCVVTHSSNVAVDAVLAGIPVFVAPTSPAAPVGRTDLEIESPSMPDRKHWLASLMCQQFTLEEMRSGLAQYWMARVAAQVDGTPEPKEWVPYGNKVQAKAYDRTKVQQIAAQARQR